ncbi:MAG: DUF116 domain-containing protein [Bacteroidetes bacterium]|nr:MAG: DUF116 domain-containing protein [Bacteroidota bacterium]
MKSVRPTYSHIEGKTYTLFGKSDSTNDYYDTIKSVADKIQVMNPSIRDVVELLSEFRSKKRVLRWNLKKKGSDNLMTEILNLANRHLKQYTENTEEYLRILPVSKLLDRRLATPREQYHIYMVEIELTNRLFGAEFRKADKKIALLPYCLQDFSANCKTEKNGFDYQCKHCSARCYQNHASKILETYDIEPYIWTAGDMRQLAKYTLKDKRTFGVLGIACIPELTWGIRSCRKNNIPVVGIALNANRCVRWFGEFFPNSVDLAELEKLVAGG